MNVILTRFAYLDNCTLGRIDIGCHVFYTMERPWKDNETFVSCIPEGEYICKKYSSKKYPNTYEITDVPKRSYILFHSGNYAGDVSGCIAIGDSMRYNADRDNLVEALTNGERAISVQNSRKSMAVFLKCLADRKEFDFTIVGGGS